MVRTLPFGLLFVACSASSAAASSIDDGLCRNGIFAIQNTSVGLGVINPGKRVHFIDDTSGCPRSDSACRLKPYLVAGDRVVTGRTLGAYVCVYYLNESGTAGWVERSRVKSLSVERDPALSAWLGHWSSYGNPLVRFYQRNGKLIAKGDAAWPSFNPSREEAPGGPHVGEIDEAVQMSGNRAYAPECEITFTLLGDLLVGADPKMQCGGANVSFSGVYRRVKR